MAKNTNNKILMYGLVAIGIIMVWKLSNYNKTYNKQNIN